MEEKNKSGLGTAGLVLGIVGVCFSFIPIINNLSFIIGVLSIIFGIIVVIKGNRKGKAIASLILGIFSILIAILMQQVFVDAINSAVDEVNNNINQVTGNSTEEILTNCVDVNLGKFEVIENEYFTNTKLVVKVTNKTSEMKSFSFQIEAINTDGSRIDNDYVYVNNLSAGQSQEFEIFTYVQDEKLETMKNATFKIVEASMY